MVFESNSSRAYPELFEKIKDSYALHLFNQYSSTFTTKIDDGSFFSAITEKNCERTFSYVKNNNLSFWTSKSNQFISSSKFVDRWISIFLNYQNFRIPSDLMDQFNNLSLSQSLSKHFEKDSDHMLCVFFLRIHTKFKWLT